MNFDLSVVLDLCQVLKDTYCHVFFDNLFNSTTLIQKLHDNGLYVLGPARSDRIAAGEKGQRNEARKLLMQILKPHSLYQMI